MTVPTLAKAGPLVRGSLSLLEETHKTKVELRVSLNRQRFLGPPLAAILVGLVVQFRTGGFSPLLWSILVAGVSSVLLSQAPFVGWARRKLITELEAELGLSQGDRIV